MRLVIGKVSEPKISETMVASTLATLVNISQITLKIHTFYMCIYIKNGTVLVLYLEMKWHQAFNFFHIFVAKHSKQQVLPDAAVCNISAVFLTHVPVVSLLLKTSVNLD